MANPMSRREKKKRGERKKEERRKGKARREKTQDTTLLAVIAPGPVFSFHR